MLLHAKGEGVCRQLRVSMCVVSNCWRGGDPTHIIVGSVLLHAKGEGVCRQMRMSVCVLQDLVNGAVNDSRGSELA